MLRKLALAGALLFAAMPAAADEVWRTDLGQVAWEKEVGDAAVFRVNLPNGKFARFYIENLPARIENRTGIFSGYWISTADEALCPAELVGPDGTRSHTWGRLELTFVKPGFPSDWVMHTSRCVDELNETLIGLAQVGDAAAPK